MELKRSKNLKFSKQNGWYSCEKEQWNGERGREKGYEVLTWKRR